MVRYRKIDLETSVILRIEHQRYGKSTYELAAERGLPQKTVYRHAIKPIVDLNRPVDKRKMNKGRPRLLTERDERELKRSVLSLRKSQGLCFSADQVRRQAGWACSRRTAAKYLHRHGYRKRQLRKKGQLTEEDRRKRLRYARDALQRDENFWKEQIVMYLDGVTFTFKPNPFQKAANHSNVGYRLKSEGLKVTAKGSKEGNNGKSVTFYVGVSFGEGCNFCKQFLDGKPNGTTFAAFAMKEFGPVFRKSNKGKKIVQDGCPVMNSAAVQAAYKSLGIEVISIPARSPDLNPVENVFNNVRRSLRQEALQKRIVKETYPQFALRVSNTMIKFSRHIIDSTIETMSKRMRQIVACRGYRTKY